MSGRKHIAIAGGGLVGAVTALALQQRGFDISLIDREQPVPGPQGLGMDIRNVALSHSSRRLIESLVDWPRSWRVQSHARVGAMGRELITLRRRRLRLRLSRLGGRGGAFVVSAVAESKRRRAFKRFSARSNRLQNRKAP